MRLGGGNEGAAWSEDELLKELYDALRKELDEERLQHLPQHLYRSLAKRIKELEALYVGGEASPQARLAKAQLELLRSMGQRLLRLRLEKATEGKGEVEALLPVERYPFQAHELYEKRLSQLMDAISQGRASVLERMESEVMKQKCVVRLLKPLPAIVGSDLLTYGPFEEGDVVVLPIENARALIKRGSAVEVEPLD